MIAAHVEFQFIAFFTQPFVFPIFTAITSILLEFPGNMFVWIQIYWL